MTYSSSLSMSRSQFVGRGQNTLSFRRKDRTLGPVSNTIILIVLACLLGLLYLAQVTKTNAYGYTINSLQKQQATLKSEHEDLEVASARLQSLDRVKTSTVAANLTTITPTDTIQ